MTSPDWSETSTDNPSITIGEQALENRWGIPSFLLCLHLLEGGVQGCLPCLCLLDARVGACVLSGCPCHACGLPWMAKQLLLASCLPPAPSPVSALPTASLTPPRAPAPRRGYPTTYNTVWIAMFAWGIGSSFVNFIIFGLACTYLSRERAGQQSLGAAPEACKSLLLCVIRLLQHKLGGHEVGGPCSLRWLAMRPVLMLPSNTHKRPLWSALPYCF